jgi:hypothetical protein
MKWLDRRIDDWIKKIRDSDRKKIPIGGDTNPTYWRWFVIPRNRFCNVYLHNFLRDDEEDLHDHRMINISVVLQGEYMEQLFVKPPQSGMPLPGLTSRCVRRLRPRFRLPSTAHRVVLFKQDNKPIPIWSLFIGLPHWRDWGFWCPGVVMTRRADGRPVHRGNARWVPWQEYIGDVSPTDPRYGMVGKGCGE